MVAQIKFNKKKFPYRKVTKQSKCGSPIFFISKVGPRSFVPFFSALIGLLVGFVRAMYNCVQNPLTYGTETWAMEAENMHSLESRGMW